MTAPPARLEVGLVGTGRLGPVLALALRRAGHRLVAATNGRRACVLGDVALLPGDEVARRSGLLLLCVPDDTLPALAAGLADTAAVRPGTLVVHTSGRHGLAVLDPIRAAGGLPMALHPAMTFTGASDDLHRLAGVTFAVTTPPQLRAAGEALVVEMGGEPVWVSDEERVRYHAALSHASNHLVTLVAQASELLGQAGVEDPARLFGPLLGAALDNVLRRGPLALTGPVVRGDVETVAAHLAVLHGSPAAPAYRVMARASADLALASGALRPEQAGALLDVLAEERSR
jgi:predicted short-subunit dehydrogenase-like oxidoreductase (DUF2520 family)